MIFPLGVGNLHKGERSAGLSDDVKSTLMFLRYSNMDYIFGSVLQLILVAMVLISYDVACQWFVNLFTRMKNDWPSEIKPFYIQDYEDGELSKGFDLMHPRMELVSGGQREHRYENLVSGFEAQGLDPEQFEYYTKMFKYGMPPHAGWAYGVERLVMTMLDLGNIREAVLFPRDRQRLSP